MPLQKHEITAIDTLLTYLFVYKGNKNMQAALLQVYIAKHGPIPDKYGEEVKGLMS